MNALTRCPRRYCDGSLLEDRDEWGVTLKCLLCARVVGPVLTPLPKAETSSRFRSEWR